MNTTIHLRSLNQKELTQFLASLGAPNYRALQILDWLHKKQVMDISEMKNVPKELRQQLAKKAVVSTLELAGVVGAPPFRQRTDPPSFAPKDASVLLAEWRSGRPLFGEHHYSGRHGGLPLQGPKVVNHNSLKYLLKTVDGHILESVLIVQGGRQTVCVSTQLGCRIRCSFCASGKGKFGRNLTAGEIVEQVSVISRRLETAVTNIVFMGMGEPLDNYEGTMKAIEILSADWGFGLGGRRITVSTSGLTPMIERFVNDSSGRVRLSISLHSSDQETRSRLVPINKKYRLRELIDSLERIRKVLKREITFEYTLIEGINDSDREARGVGRLAARLGAKVNLIPYNPIREMDYQTPGEERVESFRRLLETKHVRVTVRQTRGRDIDAACGQLRLDRTVVSNH